MSKGLHLECGNSLCFDLKSGAAGLSQMANLNTSGNIPAGNAQEFGLR